jgi:hypothetical protein
MPEADITELAKSMHRPRGLRRGQKGPLKFFTDVPLEQRKATALNRVKAWEARQNRKEERLQSEGQKEVPLNRPPEAPAPTAETARKGGKGSKAPAKGQTIEEIASTEGVGVDLNVSAPPGGATETIIEDKTQTSGAEADWK